MPDTSNPPHTSPLLQLFCRFLLIIVLKIGDLFYAFSRLLRKAKTLFSLAESDKQVRGKKPSSLETVSIIFAQEDLTRKDISKITEVINWSLKLGLQYIFIYDREGFLKTHLEQISTKIRDSNPELNANFKSGWSTDKSQKTTTIHALEEQDSISPLVKISSDPTGSYQGLKDVDKYWSTDSTMKELNMKISEQFGDAAIKEPNAVLVIGPVFTLAGCPPFHARFAEIYHFGLLQDLTSQIFISVLGKYWKTNQRFGA